ncbi:hypothetical protein AVEN_73828-1 [Araneus ventricosus]|uniref:Uncharacterized protein n=1 Tax=Araneus ventricosus TaxID=182803 RepID=A0A4Y2T184_ARAVE|nr:hypothetical protein AVEN_73828-1 [Araneus ventricosus]
MKMEEPYLRAKGEERGDAEGDPGWHRVHLDPEADPAHGDDHGGRGIRVHDAPRQPSHHPEVGEQAGVVPCQRKEKILKTGQRRDIIV